MKISKIFELPPPTYMCFFVSFFPIFPTSFPKKVVDSFLAFSSPRASPKQPPPANPLAVVPSLRCDMVFHLAPAWFFATWKLYREGSSPLKLPEFQFHLVKMMFPESNRELAPANGWLEDEISFWDGLVSGASC